MDGDPRFRDPFLRKTVRLRPGDFFGVEVRTHPGFQRRGLASAAYSLTMERYGARGYTRRVFTVAAWNAPSRQAFAARSQVIGTVGYVTVGLARRYFATGAVRLGGDEVVLMG